MESTSIYPNWDDPTLHFVLPYDHYAALIDTFPILSAYRVTRRANNELKRWIAPLLPPLPQLSLNNQQRIEQQLRRLYGSFKGTKTRRT